MLKTWRGFGRRCGRGCCDPPIFDRLNEGFVSTKGQERMTYTIPICNGCGLPCTSTLRDGQSCRCNHDHGETLVEMVPVAPANVPVRKAEETTRTRYRGG